MIYITNISEVSLNDINLLSEYRREKAERKRHNSDKLSSIAASMLLRYALKQSGIWEADMLYSENEHGKPYFKNCPEIKFSLSDSNNYAACVVSNTDAGIDIQELVTNMDFLRLAKRYFTKSEYEYVCKNGEKGFFKLWTRKESLLKALGLGISAGLDAFEVLSDTFVFGDTKFGFFDCEINGDAKLSCCSLGGRENQFVFVPRHELIAD